MSEKLDIIHLGMDVSGVKEGADKLKAVLQQLLTTQQSYAKKMIKEGGLSVGAKISSEDWVKGFGKVKTAFELTEEGLKTLGTTIAGTRVKLDALTKLNLKNLYLKFDTQSTNEAIKKNEEYIKGLKKIKTELAAVAAKARIKEAADEDKADLEKKAATTVRKLYNKEAMDGAAKKDIYNYRSAIASLQKFIVSNEVASRTVKKMYKDVQEGNYKIYKGTDKQLLPVIQRLIQAEANLGNANKKRVAEQLANEKKLQKANEQTLAQQKKAALEAALEAAEEKSKNIITPLMNPGNLKIATQKEVFNYNAATVGLQQFIAKNQVAEDVVKRLYGEIATGNTKVYTGVEAKMLPAMQRFILAQASLGDASRRAGANMSKFNEGQIKAIEKALLGWRTLEKVIMIQIVRRAFHQLITQTRMAIQTFIEFQKGIVEIRTISQANQASMETWSESVLKLSNLYGTDLKDTTNAYYETLSNQVSEGVAQTEQFVNTILQFAKVTKSTAADAVNLITAAINAYNMSATDATHVAEVFFKTIDLGRVRASDLADTMGRVLVPAAQLGLSMEEVAGMLAVITNQGVKGTEAMTLLRGVIMKLYKPTEAMKELFSKYGVTSGEAMLATYGFAGALKILYKESKGSGSEIAELFQNIRPTVGMAALLNNLERTTDYIDRITDSGTEYQKALEDQFQTPGEKLAVQLQQIKNVFMEAFGAKATEYIVYLGEAFGKTAEEAKNAGDNISGAASVIKKAISFSGTTAGFIALYAGFKKLSQVINTASNKVYKNALALDELQTAENKANNILTVYRGNIEALNNSSGKLVLGITKVIAKQLALAAVIGTIAYAISKVVEKNAEEKASYDEAMATYDEYIKKKRRDAAVTGIDISKTRSAGAAIEKIFENTKANISKLKYRISIGLDLHDLPSEIGKTIDTLANSLNNLNMQVNPIDWERWIAIGLNKISASTLSKLNTLVTELNTEFFENAEKNVEQLNKKSEASYKTLADSVSTISKGMIDDFKDANKTIEDIKKSLDALSDNKFDFEINLMAANADTPKKQLEVIEKKLENLKAKGDSTSNPSDVIQINAEENKLLLEKKNIYDELAEAKAKYDKEIKKFQDVTKPVADAQSEIDRLQKLLSDSEQKKTKNDQSKKDSKADTLRIQIKQLQDKIKELTADKLEPPKKPEGYDVKIESDTTLTKQSEALNKAAEDRLAELKEIQQEQLAKLEEERVKFVADLTELSKKMVGDKKQALIDVIASINFNEDDWKTLLKGIETAMSAVAKDNPAAVTADVLMTVQKNYKENLDKTIAHYQQLMSDIESKIKDMEGKREGLERAISESKMSKESSTDTLQKSIKAQRKTYEPSFWDGLKIIQIPTDISDDAQKYIDAYFKSKNISKGATGDLNLAHIGEAIKMYAQSKLDEITKLLTTAETVSTEEASKIYLRIEQMLKDIPTVGMGLTPGGATDKQVEQATRAKSMQDELDEIQKATEAQANATAEFTKYKEELAQLNAEHINVIASLQSFRSELDKIQSGMSSTTNEILKMNNALRVQINLLDKVSKKLGFSSRDAGLKTVLTKAKGGSIHASKGMFAPMGSDTVPAMLSPGEFVMNKAVTAKFLDRLVPMNYGMTTNKYTNSTNTTTVGDITVNVQGASSSQLTAKEIGRALKRDIQRGVLKL